MEAIDRLVDVGIRLHVREWKGDGVPFLLVHGLSSNCRTWDQVAERLAAAGHRVVAVDQRGHGLSDKPDRGYGFDAVTADLARLMEALAMRQPVVAGQSWGGNVVLSLAASHPGTVGRLALVDGGTIDLQSGPNGSWEEVSQTLRPPQLAGMPRTALRAQIHAAHPGWTEAGIEATLANFETLPDGTVRPWLTLERHMAILRALWEQRPPALYPLIREPVLICAADNGDPHWTAIKHAQIDEALQGLAQAQVHWFPHTDHDIHVHRPAELAALLLEFAG
jgi:pimeloyl-ACP methyl ester carboxylesterase